MIWAEGKKALSRDIEAVLVGEGASSMNQQALFDFHQEICRQAFEICKAKNHDYTADAGGDGEDPFANFTRVEKMGVTTTEQGFLVRMVDKMSRLSTHASLKKLEVGDETVKDTLLDLINYTILLAAYLEQKGKN